MPLHRYSTPIINLSENVTEANANQPALNARTASMTVTPLTTADGWENPNVTNVAGLVMLELTAVATLNERMRTAEEENRSRQRKNNPILPKSKSISQWRQAVLILKK